MKLSKGSILLIGSALVFASGAFAGDANKGKLHLQDKTIVDGKPLNPGNYTVEWTGSGPTVEVTFLEGKQAVATFPAHLTEQTTRNHDDAYGSRTGIGWFEEAHGHLHQWKADCPGTGTESSQPADRHVRLKVRTKERAPISFRAGPGRNGHWFCEFLVTSRAARRTCGVCRRALSHSLAVPCRSRRPAPTVAEWQQLRRQNNCWDKPPPLSLSGCR